ncbi:flagellar filament capping protein FliD [uncultured Oscillibacter sp.]|uniref:flagellar filament capping protein FliD n=1 Tax=uncultured Oscillibacter sp. TaxID=876091 RepID=UPI0026078DA1|nr:flagellar filament capping protein FliD [uncultured Oscillibacter sp.]
MASVSRTSSSSATSIYGTRNVISGLASGMDTEGMIENAISAYKNKISSLNQQRTKLSWQQEAYRDIITKMASFSSKYTSYTSSTNLMSSSFFNQAVRTVANGANAAKVAASGRGTSDVAINGVRQLATAATYKLSGSALMGNTGSDYASASSPEGFSLDKMTISSFSGTMNLTYGKNQTLSFTFSESDVFNSAEELAANMQKQLEDQTISLSSGGSKKASEMLTVEADSFGNITFKDKANNNVYISGVSDSMKEAFSVNTGEGKSSFRVWDLTKEVDSVEYLSKSPLSITLDGVTKSVKMPDQESVNKYLEEAGIDLTGKTELTNDEISARNDAYIKALQDNIDKAFGKLDDGSSKLKVTNENAAAWAEGEAGSASDIKLRFEAGQEGSSFSVTSSKGKSMGFGGTQLTSYLNTNKTLKDLLGEEGLKGLETGTDKDGNTTYALEINGVKIGDFTEKTELSTIMSRINSNKDAGVNVSYSKLSNEFTFTAKETGTAGEIQFSDKGLGGKLFGGAEQTAKGQDAIFTATVDGKEMELTRSSNIVDFDGLTVTLKGEFGYKQKVDDDGNPVLNEKGEPEYTKELDRTAEKITFTSTSDADKIVDAIKSFVSDYNEMVTQIKEAYSTLPLQRSSGAYYEPLTDDDKAEMSESAIEAWENNAKTGLLFGDRDLSSLYSRLTSAVSMYGRDGADLKAAGITVSYSNGLSTLSFDENTLRDTLNSDPDRVRDIFTKSKDNGADTNGLVAAIKEPLEVFGGTTSATKGTLVEKAGSPLAPTTIYQNDIQKQLDNLDTQIEKWQDKMSDQVDYYTTQFSKLEQLIAQMNSQSSALSQMMGSY